MKLIFAVVIVATLVPGGWMICRSMEEIDQCAYDISFLENRDIPIPTNEAEAIVMCGKAQEGLRCLLNEAMECYDGPMKSIMVKVLTDLDLHLKARCDSPSGREEFVRHVQCFVDSDKAEAIRRCSDRHIIMLEKVYTFPNTLRLGGGCCTGHSLRDCVVKKITEVCSSETGDYFNDMINDVTEENIPIVCNEFTDLDQCNQNYDPESWNGLREIQNMDDPTLLRNHRYRTAIPTILMMMKESVAKK